MVVSVGIDVSKDKHDCFILNSEGEILSDVFTIPNSLDGFTILLQRIRDCSSSQDNIKVGLEATGHYSYNILGFLLDNGLPTYPRRRYGAHPPDRGSARPWLAE